MKPGYLSLQERAAYRRLEDVVGCKWSAAVLAAIARGVTRPGQLERFIPGISTKVLNERLRKLLDYGLITRTEKPGRILQVHYHLTPTGQKLSAILDQLRELDEEHARQQETTSQDGSNACMHSGGDGPSARGARGRKRRGA